MSTRVKHGKERQDKYYYLAKEQGYRARSAFKILQLAKKFNIFENCNVLVDLCAAPGGWLQVAAKHLPVSSIIIGVDLVPIRPIKGVITIQSDIRTTRCRNLISQNLKGAEVDVVLHDGAPNVGANWNLDAFNQNVLVLEAAKLAAHVLKKGGIFVTKIFRSADYNSLIWMLGKCFERVKVTKPSSSRNVSAEIFAVCIGFRTLKALDPKLFNCEHVFISQGQAAEEQEEKETAKVTSLSQLLRQRKKVNREGYEEGDDFREHSVLDFLTSDNPPQMLISTNRFTFKPRSGLDEEASKKDAALLKAVMASALTTEEVKLLCSDIKVAGRADLQHLLKWRQKICRELFPADKDAKKSKAKAEKQDGEDDAVVEGDGEEGAEQPEAEEDALRRQQLELADRLRKDQRRSERKKRRALMKHKKAMAANSVMLTNDPELFSLSVLKGHDIDELDKSSDDSGDDSDKADKGKDDKASIHSRVSAAKRFDIPSDYSDTDSDDSDADSMDLQFETDSEVEDLEDDKVHNMEVDLEVQHEMAKLAESERAKPTKKLTRRQRVNMERGAELASLIESMQSEARLKAQQEMQESDSEDESEESVYEGGKSDDEGSDGSNTDDDEDDDDEEEEEEEGEGSEPESDADSEVADDKHSDDLPSTKKGASGKAAGKTIDRKAKEAMEDAMVDRWFDQDIFQEKTRETARKQKKKEPKKAKPSKKEASFAVVPAVSDADAIARVRDAVEEELTRDKETIAEVQAIGSLLVDKGSRMALIDGAYNRRTFDDGDLPSWFAEDEKKHSNYEMPVTKELMKRYKAKLYELKNRPIRKVLEARGRRKMRMERKLKSVLPRVEAMQNSDTGKSDAAKKLLRKVKRAASDKREKVYVVSRRGGSSTSAPKGGKGSRKVVKAVDKRMRKDNVRQKQKPRSQLVRSLSLCESIDLLSRARVTSSRSRLPVYTAEGESGNSGGSVVAAKDIGDNFFGETSPLPLAADSPVPAESYKPTTTRAADQDARIAALEAEVRLLKAQNAQLTVNACALYNTLMQHVEKLRATLREREAEIAEFKASSRHRGSP
ncbi:ribosomal RNA large subunit methyltransferase J family protein, putative [Babesia bigemina]|uniref:Putative rRNA methyltransferase n=1 Tax=Babesia bigemina TaxID=5866 RepID=A0A061DBQ2_BABBI|nr:ribosomal RNA large subunit methyltransferase J family protein, putative [Babesia bigemina]CDR97382.1 ribosomal RNA large subunit methyltransferase J family protein, putative [Babesia bigemina]|eukprot:XP_012769568.1 ribosomal RNA large subunit methyltransferase J family protein, putative [Babesia bigemina]